LVTANANLILYSTTMYLYYFYPAYQKVQATSKLSENSWYKRSSNCFHLWLLPFLSLYINQVPEMLYWVH